MDVFTQICFIIGRITPDGVNFLGTGFLVSSDGKIATTKHVIGDSVANLVMVFPNIVKANDYQDLSDIQCKLTALTVLEMDPIHDLCILKGEIKYGRPFPKLGSFDNDAVGDEMMIFGFPHCIQGRRAFTHQRAEIGAKVLIEVSGIKTKHAVLNTQARPGQSGSLIFSPKNESISGMLVGAWVPGQGGISLGGINPHELHQTTHCISAEYVSDML